VGDGGFHIKAAGLRGDRGYFAAKLNANFPGNPARHALPTIQGLVVLSDSMSGRPLAVLDSMAITILRTAAATGLAARWLARPDARIATLVGCGAQSRAQLRALALVRSIAQVFVHDSNPELALRFATEMERELGIPVSPAPDLKSALRASTVCVSCTTATSPFLHPGDISPGSFIAAVGADHETKSEVDPALMAASRVVPDLLEQAAQIGDLHHAIASGLMNRESIHAELGEVVTGRKPGRTSGEETFVFDSTGVAVQDVVAAALAYEGAVANGVGRSIDFAA
jgi:ornithine cyclodeaminase/alanine dehydrogenase-like protein (mu-crystallin family)